MFHVPEKYRIRTGPLASDSRYGNNGAFEYWHGGNRIRVIASDGEGWNHVSVSLAHRTPTWEEMCFIKDKFWDEEDQVIQFHPPKSQYVNYHPYTLHLWQPIGVEIPLPPSIMVGPK
jgi:hypothetical protein